VCEGTAEGETSHSPLNWQMANYLLCDSKIIPGADAKPEVYFTDIFGYGLVTASKDGKMESAEKEYFGCTFLPVGVSLGSVD